MYVSFTNAKYIYYYGKQFNKYEIDITLHGQLQAVML